MKGSGPGRRQCPQRLQLPGQARPSGPPPPAEQLGVWSPPSVRTSLSASPAGAGASGSAPGAGGTVPPRARRSHPRAALPAQAQRWPRGRRTQSPGPEGRGSPSGSRWGGWDRGWRRAAGNQPRQPAPGKDSGRDRGEPRGRSRSRRARAQGSPPAAERPDRQQPERGRQGSGGGHSELETDCGRDRAAGRRAAAVTSGACLVGGACARPAPGSVPGGPFRIPLASGPSARLLVPGARPRQVRAGYPGPQEASPGGVGVGAGCVLRAQGPLPESAPGHRGPALLPVSVSLPAPHEDAGAAAWDGVPPGPAMPPPRPLGTVGLGGCGFLAQPQLPGLLHPGVWGGRTKDPVCGDGRPPSRVGRHSL